MEQPGIGKVALITGVTEGDGSYLAEILLGKGYIAHGVKRRSSYFNTGASSICIKTRTSRTRSLSCITAT